MSWDDLRVFLALHRGGSQAAAARLLALDPTTTGRRLAALEAALGARLFDRTPSGLTATKAGRTLAARAERVEAEMLAAERELQGADERIEGPVRVTAGDGLVAFVLAPELPRLRRAHPGIAVELRAETRIVDLSRREADVAVRLVRPREPSLVARRATPMTLGFYASAPYLAQRATPRSVGDLASHDWIGFDPSFDGLPQVKWLRRTLGDVRWVVRCNGTVPQAVACAEGLGVALLPTFVARREPRLVPLLPRAAIPTREAWLVAHEDMRRNARVGAVLEWLASALEAALG